MQSATMSAYGLFTNARKMNSIYCDYNELVIAPKEAFDGLGPGQFQTKDGKVCTALFIAGWNNEGNRYDEQLDHICKKYWNVPFDSIRSMWIGRLGNIGNYWYFIQLKEKNGP